MNSTSRLSARANGFLIVDLDEAVKTCVELRDSPELYCKISLEALKTVQMSSVLNLSQEVDRLYEELMD